MKCLPKVRVLVHDACKLSATGHEEVPGRVEMLLSLGGALGRVIGIEEMILSFEHRVLGLL